MNKITHSQKFYNNKNSFLSFIFVYNNNIKWITYFEYLFNTVKEKHISYTNNVLQ